MPAAKGIKGAPATKGDVVIGNDVWIASNATIMSGATVGDGAVIGADSTVTGDVRPYAIVAGNPAREIRRRFDDETVEKLLALRWWDWSDERIGANVSMLENGDIESFIHAQSGPPGRSRLWKRLLGSRR